MAHWAADSIFYHIYPLGLCDAPQRNDFTSPAVPRLDQLYGWLDHLQYLGINALYIGPLFESSAHGYDTADYFQVDRRLGTNETLANLVAALHQRGIRVILDGVFNHVGRDFWAFRDVLANREGSAYCDWFVNMHFGQSNRWGDPFSYEGWNGHISLAKLNLQNPAVKDHLFRAVEMWMHTFDIDGLRLDTADCLDLGFQRELAAHCRLLRPDFWLMGEVIHGDYRTWANEQILDSVTNYECYKGLYSSHVDRNYFEIAYAFNRQFGEGGLYRDLPLYAFADNHDVNRLASNLTKPAHLYTVYGLLFTMPGVPSIYYGSEWGLTGKRTNSSDHELRPALALDELRRNSPQPDLPKAIARFADIRRRLSALRYGDYRQLFVSSEQFAFARQTAQEQVIVALNAADHPAAITIPVSSGSRLVDVLNEGDSFIVGADQRVVLNPVPAGWLRILRVE